MDEIILGALLFVAIVGVGGLLIKILDQQEKALKVLHGEVLELADILRELADREGEERGEGESALEAYLKEDVAFYRSRVLGEWSPPKDRGGVTGGGVAMGVLAPRARPSPFPSPSLPDGFTTEPPSSLPLDPIDMSGGFEGPSGPAPRLARPAPRLVPPPKVLSPEVPPPGATDAEKGPQAPSPSSASSSSSSELDQMVDLLREWPEAKKFDPAKR